MPKLSDRLKSYTPFFNAYLPEGGNLFSAFISSGPQGSSYRVRRAGDNDETAVLHVATVADVSLYERLFYQIRLKKIVDTENNYEYLDMDIKKIAEENLADVLILSKRADIPPAFTAGDTEKLNGSDEAREGGGAGNEGGRLTVDVAGRGENRRVTIDEFPCVFGRSRKSDVRLTGDHVSGGHCVLERRDNAGFTVKDLGSLNKTVLNDTELIPGEAYPFYKGDLIKIAGYTVTVV